MRQISHESYNVCDVSVRHAHKRDGRTNKAGLAKRQIPSAFIARFHSKYERAQGCWLWTAGKFRGGYGMCNLGRNFQGRQHTEYAHRIAFVLAHGEIPCGSVVMHSCDVPACVNPSHLSLGTQGDNVRDGAQKGRYTVPHFGARVLSDDQVRLIRASAEKGRDLAREFRVSEATISLIRSGQRRVA